MIATLTGGGGAVLIITAAPYRSACAVRIPAIAARTSGVFIL